VWPLLLHSLLLQPPQGQCQQERQQMQQQQQWQMQQGIQQ
jgi:hypothetical protein